MKNILIFCLTFAASVAFAVEWVNVDSEHYLGGRKSSNGYLQGKVVMVVRWKDDSDETREMLKRMEEIWTTFKNKQFVLLGSSLMEDSDGEKARQLIRECGVTFPSYASADLAKGAPKVPVYATDETGKVIFVGGKNDRQATQVIVTALTDSEFPRTVKQWKRYIDYELENLPAHAYNRLNAFRKSNREEANGYFEKAKVLVAIPDVKKVANLVSFARRAKDAPSFGPDEKEKKSKYEALVENVLTSCAVLKETEDARLRQEAKNALADLAWAKATF